MIPNRAGTHLVTACAMPARRFPPPWSVEVAKAHFVLVAVAVNIAKLPELITCYK
jgi:hypothetical protein